VTVAENLARVRERVAAASARVGRSPGEIRIVAVSKTQPPSAVVEAIAAGVDAIGENRVQEGAAKRPLAPGAVPWHLVGPLQRNKARQALVYFDLIETVDRPELADRIESLLAPLARVLPVFIEVNIGGEAQKSGAAPASSAALVEHLLARCPHLRLEGLMTVPPYDPDPERSMRASELLKAAEPVPGRTELPGGAGQLMTSVDVRKVLEGTLILELQRASDGKPVWRAGSGYGSIDEKRIDAETASAVSLLLSKYPPPKP